MTSIKLNTGAQIPLAGLGTWKSLPEEAAYDAVKHALSVGCRHIDCAWIYGNEKQVGRALNEAFANGLPREEVFVTTKLWNTKHRKEDVAGALQESLDNLGLDYVDLYLMHWPMAFAEGEDPFPKAADGGILPSSVPIQETWQALEELVLGSAPLKTRAIGVSNFSIPQLKALLDTHPRVIPAMNQIENHVYLQQPKLVQFCHDNGVAVTAYSPLGSPSRPGLKQEDPVVLEDELLIQIAQNHARSPAQIALRFLVQRGLVVIPKSVTPERISANLQLFDFTLSDEEMAALTAKDKSWRAITFNTSISHPEYPFHPHKQDIASSSL